MEKTGPLSGLKVVEFVGVGPGPFAAMWLSDMGAEVIRIDRPGQRWNQTRGDVLNRGRRSLAIDLKREGARDVALRLVDGADVLLEGFRPGVMERLGLGPDDCHARNPRLVFGRVTGWGQTGPRAHEAGHDLNYIASTGILAAIGPAERPVPPLNLIGDFGGGGMLLIAGVLAALVERATSGRGQVVDAAMAEGGALLSAMIWAYHNKGLWEPRREANLFDGGAPYYRTYRCADGSFVALGAIESEFWTRFLDLAGIEDPVLREQRNDRSLWPDLCARLSAIFLTRTRDEWCGLGAGTDACLTPVLDFNGALDDPQARARATFVAPDGAPQPAPAPRFDRTPGAIRGPSPLVGEHTRDLLAEAGFEDAEIAELEASGIVRHEAPA
ncbi:MAG: CoA transferase [Pararhodobacter sp.]|nr:CoA transferase [Pararhodobacter sp.]